MQRKAEHFMAAVRGVPAPVVANALSALTPGIDWRKCGKNYMAAQWATDEKYSHRQLHGVTLDALKAVIAKRWNPPGAEKTRRTQAIIDGFRGLPGEWYMLKGLLVAPTAIGRAKEARVDYLSGVAERKLLEDLFDNIMLAERMDEINNT